MKKKNQCHRRFEIKSVHDFSPIFHGLGKQKDFQLRLNIDDTVEPVHQSHRRVPFSTRPKVEAAIKQLYEHDICENPENTPTLWVSPIVELYKPRDPDNIRLCGSSIQCQLFIS